MHTRDSRIAAFTALPRTDKVYHHDLFQRDCTATVVKVRENLVALDRTIFYAESGGQVADHGYIAGHRVSDVRKVGGTPFVLPNGEHIMVDTVFVHVLDHPVDEVKLIEGQSVECELDWTRRFHNMQMHSLAHLMFTAVGELLEGRDQQRQTLGCFIEGDKARFDFYNEIVLDDLTFITQWVQDRLTKGGTATVSPIEGADDAFNWRLDDIEIPCGGTHVNDLSDIAGDISISRRTKGRGKVRMTISLDRSAAQ